MSTDCPKCRGSGEVPLPGRDLTETCPDCDGTGVAKKASLNPSAEAVALAVRLSGHTRCQRLFGLRLNTVHVQPCNGCLGDAATIDRELRLPERNAALLLAQGVIDISEQLRKGAGFYGEYDSQIDLLRDALAQIKANPKP